MCSPISVSTPAAVDTPQTNQDELAQRLFSGAIATLEIYSVYLGRKLDLYRTLHECGSATAGELSVVARTDERYTREWLEQQAVAGILSVDDEQAHARRRRYRLPEEHVGVLVNDLDPAHIAPISQMLVGIATTLPQVVEAYRSGAGVPFEAYGADLRDGQAAVNKPAFSTDLVAEWIPATPDLHARLIDGGRSVRIADVGCGAGWSTIALARAYPHAEVIGYDLDRASIEDAEQNARASGVRVRFECKHAAAMADDGPFDAVLILEALHDMAFPAEALTACRSALTADGSVLVVDERVAETFQAPGDAIERLMYGWSVSHCLPAARCEDGSAAIGTAIRPATVRHCARQAGFASCEVVEIDNDLFRLYRLRNQR